MAKESFQLDPNAAAYTDDQIVAKVNAATANVNADKVEDGTNNKVYTDAEKTKLSGVDDGAEVNPADLAALDSAAASHLAGIEAGAKDDQTAAEMRDAIIALPDTERKIVLTDPESGEKPILAIQRQADGKLDIDNDDQAIP